MSKKKPYASGGLVYSTDPGFILRAAIDEEAETLAATQQKMRVRLDTKNRAGKAVTLVEGFIGTSSDREELGKKLKAFCGTGGSVKDGEIIVQGDNRDKVLQWLQKNGYTASKRI
jgi:translation initiation factor 1